MVRLIPLAWALVAAASVSIGYELWQSREAGRFNELLRRGESFETYRPQTPQVRFARAHALHRQGRAREALAAYGGVGADAPSELWTAAKFNTANLYLEFARELERGDAPELVAPLIELAKETYRELLRADSSHWDAKYNLEVALALLPEAEDEAAAEEVMPERSRRAAAAIDSYEELP